MWGVWVLIYFAVAIAGHAVLCRLPLRGNFVVKFLLVGGLLGVALGAHEVLSHGLAIEAWTALLLYAFACELYIFLFIVFLSFSLGSPTFRLLVFILHIMIENNDF